MMRYTFTIILAMILIAAFVIAVFLLNLIIKALKSYIRSKEVREDKIKNAKSLGEVLKQHRLNSKMTQEFVAEAIGVSRQAVSKWESGISDPSTTNLIAIANLYNIAPEDLLREVQE